MEKNKTIRTINDNKLHEVLVEKETKPEKDKNLKTRKELTTGYIERRIK
jgi:hypothetical protein